jgi:hypothetical protein
MGGERSQDAVHGGVRQVETGSEVAETEATGCLERQQDAHGSVNALDHLPNFLEEIS